MLTFLDNEHPELHEAVTQEFAQFLQQLQVEPIHSPLHQTSGVALGYHDDGKTVRYHWASRQPDGWKVKYIEKVRA